MQYDFEHREHLPIVEAQIHVEQLMEKLFERSLEAGNDEVLVNFSSWVNKSIQKDEGGRKVIRPFLEESGEDITRDEKSNEVVHSVTGIRGYNLLHRSGEDKMSAEENLKKHLEKMLEYISTLGLRVPVDVPPLEYYKEKFKNSYEKASDKVLDRLTDPNL